MTPFPTAGGGKQEKPTASDIQETEMDESKPTIELEGRRRAMQLYRNDISRIDRIARGERAAAEEKRRDDELKTKEEGNNIRSTGKVPRKCCCCFF